MRQTRGKIEKKSGDQHVLRLSFLEVLQTADGKASKALTVDALH